MIKSITRLFKLIKLGFPAAAVVFGLFFGIICAFLSLALLVEYASGFQLLLCIFVFFLLCCVLLGLDFERR